jgi:hypothetical protein
VKLIFGLATIASTFLALVTPQLGRTQGVFPQPFPPANTAPVTPIRTPSVPQNSGAIGNPSTTTIIDPFAPITPNSDSVPGSIDILDYGSSYPNVRYVPSPPSPVIPRDRQLDPRGARYACTNGIIGSPNATPSALNRYTGQPCR